MNKYLFGLLFLLVVTNAFGQKKSKVELLRSQRTNLVKGPNGKYVTNAIQGTFLHEGTTLSADSAFHNQALNTIDAIGHVVINQGDTLHIYSDKLHYEGNTKLATLTDNVKMVDRDATLTTNYLTYNTATRIGTYTGGGKLINKENTLVSKNGYYFAASRDSYFRYDVVFTTPDAVIRTDTLRYNSGTRISYFYGPTTITGKDKDVLYTENGRYETVTEQAFFGKKNLYTAGTKSLKGDSLFYDRLKGYGRAVKNVTFHDSKDKATVKGGLGEYFKAEENAIITINPYMTFITQDSTKKDTTQKTTTTTAINEVTKGLPADLTLKGVTDSIMKKLPPGSPALPVNSNLTLKGITDSVMKKLPAAAAKNPAANQPTLQSITDAVMKNVPASAKSALPDSKAILKAVTDSVNKRTTAVTRSSTAKKPVISPPKNTLPYNPTLKPTVPTDKAKVPPGVKQDTLYLGGDTIETRMITYKQLKELKLKRYLATLVDTSVKVVPSIIYKTSPKFIELEAPKWFKDTLPSVPAALLSKPKPVKQAAVKPKAPAPKLTAADSIKLKQKADSIELVRSNGLRDTSRVRIMFAYHNAKIFKSDLQAKADSMFYSSSDSTIRSYVNPMIWTQGAQLSGDTINIQMKRRQLDNMDLYPSGFIVHVEKTDSTHYNQAGGKKIHGSFKNNKLSSMLITGNAETIYYNRDTVTHKITELARTVSGSLRATFNNNELTMAGFYQNPEHRFIPIAKVKEDEKFLKAFIWKPKERPENKEAILNPKKKQVSKKAPAVKPGTGKQPAASPTKTPDKAAANTKILPPNKEPIKVSKDGTRVDSAAVKRPVLKDSVAVNKRAAKDSSAVTKPAVKDTSTVKEK